MIFCGMVLGEIAGEIGVSYFPEDDNLALVDMILNPVESHVDGFGEELLDIIVGNTGSGGVVGGEGGGELWVSHFVYVIAEAGAILGFEEEPTNFGFGFQGHYVLDDGGDGVDVTVVGQCWIVKSWGGAWSCGFALREEVSSQAAVGLDLR